LRKAAKTMKFSLLLSGLFFKQVFGQLPHPEPNDRTFVVNEGPGLDLYDCGDADLPRGTVWLNSSLFIGDVDLNNIQSVSLVLPAYDVDIPDEVDHAFFNGRMVGSFIGSNDNWHLNTFSLNVNEVNYDAYNDISIHVDELNQGWCVSVDWIAVEFDYATIFPEHGDSLVHDSNGCADLLITLGFQNPSDTTCNAQASLLDSSGFFIDAYTERIMIDSVDEVGEFDMVFSGSLLGEVGREGPFSVTGVLVTCDNGAQYLTPVAHTTAAYTLLDMQCPNAPASTERENPTPSGVYGDPHIRTWNGAQYDFHGVCDLVLLRNPEFGNGAGLDVHIRTKKMRQWSYVESAVARIGENILEVRGGEKSEFWINGIQGTGDDELVISEYERISDTSLRLVVDLGDSEGIVFKTWNSFVSIRVENPKYKNFVGSVGLMGSFPDGLKIGRKNNIIEDINTFGQDWQVLSSEQKLFRDIEGPQHPQHCEIPTSVEMRRRLAASLVTVEEAEGACIGANSEDKDLCIFDVMATNDHSSAGAY